MSVSHLTCPWRERERELSWVWHWNRPGDTTLPLTPKGSRLCQILNGHLLPLSAILLSQAQVSASLHDCCFTLTSRRIDVEMVFTSGTIRLEAQFISTKQETSYHTWERDLSVGKFVSRQPFSNRQRLSLIKGRDEDGWSQIDCCRILNWRERLILLSSRNVC